MLEGVGPLTLLKTKDLCGFVLAEGCSCVSLFFCFLGFVFFSQLSVMFNPYEQDADFLLFSGFIFWGFFARSVLRRSVSHFPLLSIFSYFICLFLNFLSVFVFIFCEMARTRRFSVIFAKVQWHP